jgi:hypothetical protein
MAKPVATLVEAIMWKRTGKWWQAWGDLVRVRGLDDRLLADMGLDRETLCDRVMGRESQADTDIAALRALPSLHGGAGCPRVDLGRGVRD